MPRPSADETRYAQGEDGYVAYQVFGTGSQPLLLVTSWLQNLDVMWDEPTLARYLDRLGSFARVLAFDKRGSGVSDPVSLSALPTLEQWMYDAKLTLDAAGVESTAVVGDCEGGPMALLLAATYPKRVSALVLVNSFARWRRDADYPIGMPDVTMDRLLDRYEQNWGVTADILDLTAPSVAGDGRFRDWFTRYQRLAMPRGAATTMYRWVTEIDVRAVLPAIRVPTLVIQRADARHHRAGYGRYLADHIPGAQYAEVPGADTFPPNAGDPTPVLDRIEEFLTGHRAEPTLGRMLATVLMTDIVGSTDLASHLGDAGWSQLLKRHDAVVRELLARYRGREVNTTGDGFVAVFDGPGRAVTFAARAVAALQPLGLNIRAGLHTGEVEMTGDQLVGVAAHVASRIMSLAQVGGIMVSSTVKDLVLGSGIEFTDRGTHQLKGVPGEWRAFEAVKVP
jgi:class 3 adenylate cyclase